LIRTVFLSPPPGGGFWGDVSRFRYIIGVFWALASAAGGDSAGGEGVRPTVRTPPGDSGVSGRF